jgi:hypothetical protein
MCENSSNGIKDVIAFKIYTKKNLTFWLNCSRISIVSAVAVNLQIVVPDSGNEIVEINRPVVQKPTGRREWRLDCRSYESEETFEGM